MNRHDPNHDKSADELLDQILDGAEWPEPDDAMLTRLENHWDATLKKTLERNTVATPPNNEHGSSLSGSAKLCLAIAALLFIGCAIAMTARQTDKSDEVVTSDPAKPESQTSPKNRSHPDSTIPDSPNEPARPDTPGDRLATSDSGAVHSTSSDSGGPATQAEYLGLLAGAQSKRKASDVRNKSWDNIRHRLFEQITSRIGQARFLASATQVILMESDRYYLSMRRQREISSRQLKQYFRNRQAWEKWAWRLAESKTSRHQMGSLRFAIAVSTRDSLRQLKEHLPLAGLEHDAAIAIGWHGTPSDIDAAIRQTGSDRIRTHLLKSLLVRPDREAAMAFLKHLRDPVTSSLAIELANSTDQLPTRVWLDSIANRDNMRWDSAMAVSQVCDRKVIEGLIQLAADPLTSRPAMVALISSRCSDAQSFIAYAETDQHLAGQLSMARRKLAQIEKQNERLETENDTQGL